MSKYKCPNCKRAVDSSKEYCPFCSTPNPNIKNDSSKSEMESFDTLTDEEFFEEEFNEMQRKDSHPDENIDQSEQYGEMEMPEEAMETMDDELGESDDIEEDDDDLYDNSNYDDPDDYEDEVEQEGSTSTISKKNKRSKIAWKDKNNKKNTPDEPMFDEQGTYNANYDGYYNDTLPRIADEVDNLLKSKEKAILKAVASVVAIIAVIVYLVMTL